MTTTRKRWLIVGAAAAWVAVAHSAPPRYDFTLDTPASGLDATIEFMVSTSGTLIGNFDALNNPTGTRTKPGLFGSFGNTENVAVIVHELAWTVGDRVQTHPAGTFTATLDSATNQLKLGDLDLDLLGGQPAELPAEVLLHTESFRTRNPDSVYPGGTPITLPVGNITLATLTVVQQGGPVAGVLTPTAPGQYDFVVAVPVELTAALVVFGQTLPSQPVPTLFPLEGQIVVQGPTARLTSLRTIDFQNTQQPGLALPQFELGVPTILPPGQTANLLFNLVLDQTGSTVTGTNTLAADGTLVAGLPGDLNCDGVVDFGDINPFVLALTNPAAYPVQYPQCNILNGDINGDGLVDFGDINPFVRLLTNP